MDDIMIKLGQVIKKLRTQKGWSQKQLAEEFGVNQNTVSQWENGHRILDVESFQQVLSLLDASLSIQALNLSSSAYQLEPSTYIGSELLIQIHPHATKNDIYCVRLERSGLALILPEFHFGESYQTLEVQQACVLKALAFDYALVEDCPTLTDYFYNRGVDSPTEQDIQDFNQLKHDMELALTFFDWQELAYLAYDE